MRLKIGSALFAVLGLMVAGCGSSSSTSSTSSTKSTSSKPSKPTPASKPVGAPGAKVVFVSPKSGSTGGPAVKVVVKVTGFALSPQTVGKAAKKGQGHLHFSMDEGKFDQPKYSGPNGQLAVKLGVQGKYSPSVTPTITYMGLPKGKHKLEVYLANNDHSNTGVSATTSFTVK